MMSGNIYNRNLIDKLGNTIIYLSDHMGPLYKTKVLKLIYLIEEISIKKFGIPFLGVEFQVWRLGPVVKDLFIDLSSTPEMLETYIETVGEGETTIIKAKLPFNDDEFSEQELEILEKTVTAFGDYSAADLVQLTHRENSPWYITAQNLGYLGLFEKKLLQSTDVVLDLSMLLDDSPELKSFYLDHLEFLHASNRLKGHV